MTHQTAAMALNSIVFLVTHEKKMQKSGSLMEVMLKSAEDVAKHLPAKVRLAEVLVPYRGDDPKYQGLRFHFPYVAEGNLEAGVSTTLNVN